MGTLSARGFLEPPALAGRVAAGELPPIDERLPREPFVVGPGVLLQQEHMDWQDGRYGGTLNGAATFATGFVNLAGGSTILRSPSQTTATSVPNIVSAFSHSDDYTTFRFTIREGLRWSDGVPVTTDDVRFTFEDIYGDPDVQRPWPTDLYTQGDANLGPAKLSVTDQYTFELVFSKPYGSFVASLNSWIPNYDIIFKPAHYLKQFHRKYAKPDVLERLVRENKRSSWVQLLQSKDVPHWEIGEARAMGLPVLNAWVLAEATESRRVYERNPFFWHVDASGRQLPYIDKVVNNIVVDTDAQTNAILAGQVSIASGGEVTLAKMPVYLQNAQRSNLNVFTTGSFNNPPLLFLNHDYDYQATGSGWQKLVTDPDRRFGRALAAAMDSDGVNKSVFFGQYGPPMLNNTVHDPALAKRLLDEAGMNRLDGNGFRLGPDGRQFTLRITYAAASADFTPVAELLKEQIEAVGIRVDVDRVDTTLFDQRKAANQLMASLAWNDGPAWPSGISEDYLPVHKGPWSPATWTYYITGGKEGRQPPAYLKAFYDLHTARKQFPPESAQGRQVYDQLMRWLQDNYVFIPTTGARTTPNVVDKRLRNVPKKGAPYELDTYINAEAMWFAEQ
ncbi:ABC transporter substrate-binding protein [Micromonospora echinospora]|uniref:ABC transporter substrate-binding protein n=1 Tax=Micromonospora echinospora TaxID=1877 RepID=UPI0037BA946B